MGPPPALACGTAWATCAPALPCNTLSCTVFFSRARQVPYCAPVLLRMYSRVLQRRPLRVERATAAYVSAVSRHGAAPSAAPSPRSPPLCACFRRGCAARPLSNRACTWMRPDPLGVLQRCRTHGVSNRITDDMMECLGWRHVGLACSQPRRLEGRRAGARPFKRGTRGAACSEQRTRAITPGRRGALATQHIHNRSKG